LPGEIPSCTDTAGFKQMLFERRLTLLVVMRLLLGQARPSISPAPAGPMPAGGGDQVGQRGYRPSEPGLAGAAAAALAGEMRRQPR
jgi:hypothetical protein